MRGLIVTAVLAALLGACGQRNATPVVTMAEAPSVTPKTEDEAMAQLIGSWRSAFDAKSTLTITADGAWIGDYKDDYTGGAELRTESAWRVFTVEDAPSDAPVSSLETGKVYLEVRGSAGPMHYEVGGIAADRFELFYLGRSARQLFERVG